MKKYYKINRPYGDSGVSGILDDKELQLWLRDGSLEVGDIIIEAKQLWMVEETKERFISEMEGKEDVPV